MPTSAVGSSQAAALYDLRGAASSRPHSAAARGRAGFTLLELLVVIAIIAMATVGVGFAMRDAGQTTLDREGERLVALLESARARSRASGATVRWHLTPEGPGAFVFDGLPPDALPNEWMSTGIGAQPIAADGTAAPALQLGPDPIIAAQQLVLTSVGPPARELRIGTDGLRPFAIVSP